MRQLALPMRLRSASVFETFYAGRNAAALDRLRMLQAGDRPVAVWLYGPTGVGKSHLLQAICARAGVAGRAAAYIPLRDPDCNAEMLGGCEALDFTCVDDLEARVGDAAWEAALFRLYTELEDRGGRLVLASSGPPGGVAIKLRDLASRLAAGEVLRLEALTDADQVAALQLRATRLGLELPQETAQFLLRRLPRDMHSLCDVLDKLDEASLAAQRRLTVPLVREVLDRQKARE